MKNQDANINYGNTSDVMDRCPSCGGSSDSHGIPLIRPDKETIALAKKLQGILDGVVKGGLQKGWDPARDTCMVGAATAMIGSRKYTFAAISGADVGILNHIQGNQLGKNVTLIKAESALPLMTVEGKPLVMTQPAAWGRNRDYKLGACAAQKLVMAIFKARKEAGGKIAKINMAEILWSAPSLGGHNRDWSTGSVVCSCDTCKRVVPRMLCDRGD